MRRLMLILVCVVLLPAPASTESQDSKAAQIKESAELLCKLLTLHLQVAEHVRHPKRGL